MADHLFLMKLAFTTAARAPDVEREDEELEVEGGKTLRLEYPSHGLEAEDVRDMSFKKNTLRDCTRKNNKHLWEIERFCEIYRYKTVLLFVEITDVTQCALGVEGGDPAQKKTVAS